MTCQTDLNTRPGRDVGDEADLHEVVPGHGVETAEDGKPERLSSSGEPEQAAERAGAELVVLCTSHLQVSSRTHQELVVENINTERFPDWPRPGNFSLSESGPVNLKPGPEVEVLVGGRDVPGGSDGEPGHHEVGLDVGAATGVAGHHPTAGVQAAATSVLRGIVPLQ